MLKFWHGKSTALRATFSGVTDVAKLARELRIGDVLREDVLPARVIQSLDPGDHLITVRSAGPDGGDFEEAFSRDHLVTIQVPD